MTSPTGCVTRQVVRSDGASPRRDEIVQRHLGLPAGTLSGSLLPCDGIAEVVDLLRLPVPATLVDLACGRAATGWKSPPAPVPR
jgi:hypothetical protein